MLRYQIIPVTPFQQTAPCFGTKKPKRAALSTPVAIWHCSIINLSMSKALRLKNSRHTWPSRPCRFGKGDGR